MIFLAVIPARSNSKSVKNKNMFRINKQPLIQYTFKELKKSFVKNKYLLSDNKKIKKLAEKYKVSTEYASDMDRGIRWDDPDIGIDWPISDPLLSEKDANLPTLVDTNLNI